MIKTDIGWLSFFYAIIEQCAHSNESNNLVGDKLTSQHSMYGPSPAVLKTVRGDKKSLSILIFLPYTMFLMTIWKVCGHSRVRIIIVSSMYEPWAPIG